jgi:hypothetical protein
MSGNVQPPVTDGIRNRGCRYNPHNAPRIERQQFIERQGAAMNIWRRFQLVRELEDLPSGLFAMFGRTSVRNNRDREAMSADGQVPSMDVEEGERVRWLGFQNLVNSLRLYPPAFPRKLRAKVRFFRNMPIH